MTLQSEGKNHHFECPVLGEHFKETIVGSVSSGANHFSLKLTIKIERLQRRRSWTCTAAFSDDLGFANPVISATALFLVLWLALIAVEEVLQQSAPKAWKDYPSGIIALRILAIGFLGPIAEELVFRGLLMSVLRRTRIGVYGAVFVTAALWSMVHIQYDLAILALIFVDGIVLGLARHFTRSVYVPIVMHIAGNLFSISQSLHSVA